VANSPTQAQAGSGLGKLTELKQRLLFVIGALVVFRFGTFIPVPGVNPEAMTRLMDQQRGTIVDMFNMFSGGSIIIQLLAQVMPSLQALRKEGESGRRKLTQYTRIGTVFLCAFQAMGVAMALQSSGAAGGIPVVVSPGPAFVFSTVVGLTAGTMFLMWRSVASATASRF
jgi:preprotein translocase subunit SecY